MRKHLTDDKINSIVGIIDGWTGKLTWNLLVEQIEPIHGRYSRQTLEKQDRIKKAFSTYKTHLRYAGQSKTSNLSATETKMQERINRLEAENRRLEKENNDLLAQFVRWQYNAAIKGLKMDQLNAPLPEVDREPTKKRKAF